MKPSSIVPVLAALGVTLLASGCSLDTAALPLPGFQNQEAQVRPVPAPTPAATPLAEAKVSAAEVGWGARGDAAWATGVLRNTGTASAATAATFTAFGGAGEVLAVGSSVAVEVRAGETTAVGVRLELPPYATIARVTAQLRTEPVVDASRVQYTVAGVNVAFRGQRVLGTVASSTTAGTQVTAVCYDRSGSIVGGGASQVGVLGEGGATTFQVDTLVGGTPKRCAVYAGAKAA